MRILIGCECSGILRTAFRRLGHDAFSVDLQEDENFSPYHIKGCITTALVQPWDMLVAFPPCTHLAASGAKHFVHKQHEQRNAIDFVKFLWSRPIPHIALENPVGVLSTVFRKPTQIVQPWMFGDDEMKTTCLWLKNLPKLHPTYLSGNRPRSLIAYMPQTPDRAQLRSRTYPGMANAMASQWGEVSATVPQLSELD